MDLYDKEMKVNLSNWNKFIGAMTLPIISDDFIDDLGFDYINLATIISLENNIDDESDFEYIHYAYQKALFLLHLLDMDVNSSDMYYYNFNIGVNERITATTLKQRISLMNTTYIKESIDVKKHIDIMFVNSFSYGKCTITKIYNEFAFKQLEYDKDKLLSIIKLMHIDIEDLDYDYIDGGGSTILLKLTTSRNVTRDDIFSYLKCKEATMHNFNKLYV